MHDPVIFQMYSGKREELIEKHVFYVEQAKKRLLDQFTDSAISSEADRAAEESWKRRGLHFNPDYHDEGAFGEAAYDDGVWRHQLLSELRDNVRLSIVSGFLHEWEKSLRQWLVDELVHWHSGSETKMSLWKQNLTQIFEFLECISWSIKGRDYFHHLDACRLVINVYKHGDGPSLNELSKKYPQYLEHPFEAIDVEIAPEWLDQSHEHLRVTDRDLASFSQSVVDFWRDVPNNILESEIASVPNWFRKAIERDAASS